MHEKGFTLVELMVSVAIIIILAAILIPRYVDISSTAKTARCHANQRTLEAAALMYSGAVTNTDHVPPATPSDLVPTFMAQIPSCPENGTYSFNAYMQAVCSIATHARAF